jgi:GNAT superfamily N-acetyltransferase
MTVPAVFTVRPAELRDVAPIVQLIRELAEFEKLTDLLQVTPERLRPQLFGEKPAAEAYVAELAADEVGEGESPIAAFALFFTSFSTFLGQPGLYLEDLYVKPSHRRNGIGRALLTRLGRLAVERNYGRFEWSVLDWNEEAIRFYEKFGATVLPEWRVCRMAGDALQQFRV